MLEGDMEIVLSGFAYHLFAGDCLYMRLVDANTFRNSSAKPARYAVILTSQEPTL
jgi:glyoxylate utilization-related uncharacterized protein